jgi:hypothetical protein
LTGRKQKRVLERQEAEEPIRGLVRRSYPEAPAVLRVSENKVGETDQMPDRKRADN